MAIEVRTVRDVPFDDVRTVLGERGQPSRCQCQGYRLGWNARRTDDVEGRRELLRDQVLEDHGLIAYVDGEPAGWCSIAPRCDYPYLRETVWRGRHEDRDDAGVWAVTCFVTRAGFRRQGVSRALATNTIELPRDNGARAIEAYPMDPPSGDVPWGDMHVGALAAFLAAGYRIVSRPSLRRAIVRYDF